MVLDRMFCPTRSSKSSKKSSVLHHNNKQNEPPQTTEPPANHRSNHRSSHNTSSNNNTNSNNVNPSNPINYTNIPYRYVTADFQRVEEDEITVYAGDVVLYEFSDEDGKEWSHVLSLTRNERGFVPSDILSLEPKRFSQCVKKKLPRSMTDNPAIDNRHHHHHQHGGAHSHKTHCTSERTCHSNGGSIKLHQPHHLRMGQTPQFDLAVNSLQGSSGCQTFQKFPDYTHFSPPSYYNLNAPHMTPQYDECQPFLISYNGYGCFVVTHNFVAREENDLEVKQGEYVTVLNKDDKDWFWVQRAYDKRQGFVPARFLCPEERFRDIMHKGNSTNTMKSSNQNDFHTYINHGPERESLPTDQQSSVPVVFPLN